MLLLIDNYDSFTYNLYQYLSELGVEVHVERNDMISVEEIEKLRPDRIVISPGPSTPQNAGISNDVITHFAADTPLLGVCLGHQCIGHSFGGRVEQAKTIMHGKSSVIDHDGKGLFKGIPQSFSAIRYHSLMVEEDYLPGCLEISARTDDGTIMGLRHRQYAVEGIQFHPESFMTQHGKTILANFLQFKTGRSNSYD